jgi:hypothetical protein
MSKPVDITDQTWAFLLILAGCGMVLLCKHFGIVDDIGSGIIGAGTMAFTNGVKQAHDTTVTGSPNTTVIESPKK